jgi:N-acetylglucosamine-6-phosphate deacetylase
VFEPASSASKIAILNGTLVLADQLIMDGVLIASDGMIQYVGPRRDSPIENARVIDAAGCWVAPGFVDIHVHGGDGADFMDGTPEAVQAVMACHARHGTTSIFPTTTTGSHGQIDAMLEATKAIQHRWRPTDGARIAGVHLYGPYFAADKVGCHRLDGRRDPSPAEFDRYFQSNVVRIATCAAELNGADAFYRAAAQNQCLITCGHSNSTWQEMQRAFDAGMRHVDHFWCAMSSVVSLRTRCGTPMQASMEQFVLANREMSTEVIADGCHLSDELLDFAFRMKGADRMCLVTDSSRGLDMPPGRYRFGNESDGEWFIHDGQVGRNPDGTGLASSTAGMDRMVRNMYRATKASLHDVIRMASLTPAERTGIADRYGSLSVGKVADIVILDHEISPVRVFIQGEEIWAS